MRIAMVSEHASPLAVVGGVDAGGQNVHVAALAQSLAARGHEVVVYTRRDSRRVPERVRMSAGVTVVHLPAGPAEPIAKDDLLPFVPELGRALAQQLRLFRPDVVHAHFWMSGMASDRALRSGGMTGAVPLVQTFHALGVVKRRWQGPDDLSPAERCAAEAALLRRADRVIATCTDEVAELCALGGDPSLVDVVPCGVDVRTFTPDGKVAARSGLPRVLALGRLVPRKGVDDAIAAVALLPDVELVVAGGPATGDLAADPEATRLRALADRLGVGSRVHLLGRVPREKLPELIRSAEVALCLPWYEPFGIVPLEAMACAVPVVGSAVGGLLDTVEDGVTGSLVPVHRPDLAAQAVDSLLADQARRRRLGRAGVRRVRAHYSWASVAAATERSYDRAVRDAIEPRRGLPIPKATTTTATPTNPTTEEALR